MQTATCDADCDRQSARSWFKKGEAALCESRHLEAARCFSQVLEVDPFNAKAYRRLSNAYWGQGKTEDALNSLTRALELEPGDRETVLECARVFEALGKRDFAEEVLRSYLDKHPEDEEFRSRLESVVMPAEETISSDAAEFFSRKGEIQFKRGNIAHATACFEMAIEEDPMMAEAYNNLGVISLEEGKTTEALENFYKALELKPEGAEILLNSARGLARADRDDVAIEVYREYLRRCPEDNNAWAEFEFLIRQSAAPKWCPDGLSSEAADVYLHAAEELAKAGDLKGAAEAVERTLRIKPATAESLYVLASLHCAVGQKHEAEAILDQALVISPSDARCSEMLASLRNGNGGKAFGELAD